MIFLPNLVERLRWIVTGFSFSKTISVTFSISVIGILISLQKFEI